MPFFLFLENCYLQCLLLRRCFILKNPYLFHMGMSEHFRQYLYKNECSVMSEGCSLASSSWSQVTSWLIPEIASLKWKKKLHGFIYWWKHPLSDGICHSNNPEGDYELFISKSSMETDLICFFFFFWWWRMLVSQWELFSLWEVEWYRAN